MTDLINRVKSHEGYRRKPYRDTTGKLTIGYGRNLDDNGITEAEASFLLIQDLMRAEAECMKALYFFGRMDEVRQGVLTEMCFNLGLPKLLGFKVMLAACEVGNYNVAAEEMLGSRWAKQVGKRANTLAEIMRKGKE